jgi:hypothetical protein
MPDSEIESAAAAASGRWRRHGAVKGRESPALASARERHCEIAHCGLAHWQSDTQRPGAAPGLCQWLPKDLRRWTYLRIISGPPAIEGVASSDSDAALGLGPPPGPGDLLRPPRSVQPLTERGREGRLPVEPDLACKPIRSKSAQMVRASLILSASSPSREPPWFACAGA